MSGAPQGAAGEPAIKLALPPCPRAIARGGGTPRRGGNGLWGTAQRQFHGGVPRFAVHHVQIVFPQRRQRSSGKLPQPSHSSSGFVALIPPWRGSLTARGPSESRSFFPRALLAFALAPDRVFTVGVLAVLRLPGTAPPMVPTGMRLAIPAVGEGDVFAEEPSTAHFAHGTPPTSHFAREHLG